MDKIRNAVSLLYPQPLEQGPTYSMYWLIFVESQILVTPLPVCCIGLFWMEFLKFKEHIDIKIK